MASVLDHVIAKFSIVRLINNWSSDLKCVLFVESYVILVLLCNKCLVKYISYQLYYIEQVYLGSMCYT